MAKEKKPCNSCKKKKVNNLTSLTDVPFEDIEKAYNLVVRSYNLKSEDLDFVERVFRELYPTAAPLQRNCGQCLKNVAKSITYEYNKRKNG